MQLQPIKPARVSDFIIEQIKTQIISGALKPGDKLPAERELVNLLKVSRPSVREALLKLEAQGLIESKQGGGTFILDALAPTIINPLANLVKDNPEALSDVMECRHGLEELAASYAAARATDTDLKNLRSRFQALEAVHIKRDLSLEAKEDASFHMGDTALNNWEKIYAREESYQGIHEQHGKMLQAILSRDSELARDAAHEHLAFIGRCLRDVR